MRSRPAETMWLEQGPAALDGERQAALPHDCGCPSTHPSASQPTHTPPCRSATLPSIISLHPHANLSPSRPQLHPAHLP